MVQTNFAFEIVYEDVISMPLVYFLSTILFHVHFDVSYNKREKHQHLWELSV
jgi:hypothetical protein